MCEIPVCNLCGKSGFKWTFVKDSEKVGYAQCNSCGGKYV